MEITELLQAVALLVGKEYAVKTSPRQAPAAKNTIYLSLKRFVSANYKSPSPAIITDADGGLNSLT